MKVLLRPLLPPEVLVDEIDPESVSPAGLLPAEAEQVARAVARRRREYAAGRLVARRLLARLGAPEGFALVNDPDRAPVWPPGIVGSITHTRGRVAVAVARAADLAAVGCDLERDLPLGDGVRRRISVASERDWLAGHPEARRGRLAKLLFSAKEAVFKAQFPLTRTFLGFADVAVTIDLAGGGFTAVLEHDRGPWRRGARLTGRWRAARGLVAAAVVIRPGEEPPGASRR